MTVSFLRKWRFVAVRLVRSAFIIRLVRTIISSTQLASQPARTARSVVPKTASRLPRFEERSGTTPSTMILTWSIFLMTEIIQAGKQISSLVVLRRDVKIGIESANPIGSPILQ